MTTVAKMPLGRCSACGDRRPLTKDGLVRKHKRWDLGTWHAQPCSGSGLAPSSESPATDEPASSLVAGNGQATGRVERFGALHGEMMNVCTWARENGYLIAYDWIMNRFAEYENDERLLPLSPSATTPDEPASPLPDANRQEPT